MPLLSCALACFVLGQAPAEKDFARHMLDLERQHRLSPFARFESKRFVAISDAADTFSTQHLRYCELFHDIFVQHFRERGFTVRPAAAKLELAIFDSPRGFEAYLGRRMSANVIGIYHVPTNRLVLYDLHQNVNLLAARAEGLRQTGAVPGASKTIQRRYDDFARDLNLGATMHECAHLLSFNCGLLDREADRPLWLVEGLACYCESTNEGDWQSLGSTNPMRVDELAKAHGRYIPLHDLVDADAWVGSQRVLLGYAQSWALFRMLMQEQPKSLRAYLATVKQRPTSDYRVADFRAAFARDWDRFERRYQDQLDDLAHRQPARAVR